MSGKTPLPLEATLRDLAVLRASDVQLGKTLANSATVTNQDTPELEESLTRAVEFIKDARAVTRVDYEVEKQGVRLEDVRGRLDEVQSGLSS